METTLRVLDIVEGTSVDGTGLRTSIYFAGCEHHCEGCHNPQSWDANGGKPYTITEILSIIEYNRFDVTFSGGDPLLQIDALTLLAKEIKQKLGKNIWCYTGFYWETLIANEKFRELLNYVDIVVDSPFILARRDTALRFRGSSNQRIIDVKQSLATRTVVLKDL